MKTNFTEEDIRRLSDYAGRINKMFMHTRKDPNERLMLAAGMAGHACYQAVKKNGGIFEVVGFDDGRNFYFGDALNYYLIESHYSVYNLIMGYYSRQGGSTGYNKPDIRKMVSETVGNISNMNFMLAGKFKPEDVYKEITECWDGIFDNMTGPWCPNSDEWPVLFGIVLQLTLFSISAPPEKLVKTAMEYVLYISKMGTDSVRGSVRENNRQNNHTHTNTNDDTIHINNHNSHNNIHNQHHNQMRDAANLKEALREGNDEKIEKAAEMMYRFYDRNNNSITLDEKQEKFIRDAIDTSREFFKENQIAFSLASDSEEMSKTMEFTMLIDGVPTVVWFKASVNPLLFCIVFHIPFKANISRMNRICAELCQMNYGRPTGTFQIDTSDGQIINFSSFPCYNGMCRDNLIMSFIHNMKIVSANMSKFREFSN